MSEIITKAFTRGELTANAIRQAIVRIEKGRPKIVNPGRKLSIASVAEEAQVSRASIHNNYPGLAERIREITNKSVRSQRDKKNDALNKIKTEYSKVIQECNRLRKLNQDLASEMASIVAENQRLRAIVESNNVIVLPSRK